MQEEKDYPYKKGTGRGKWNSGLRAEIAGGSSVLDLLELCNKIRSRGTVPKPAELIGLIEEKLNVIKSEMIADLKQRYNITKQADQNN